MNRDHHVKQNKPDSEKATIICFLSCRIYQSSFSWKEEDCQKERGSLVWGGARRNDNGELNACKVHVWASQWNPLFRSLILKHFFQYWRMAWLVYAMKQCTAELPPHLVCSLQTNFNWLSSDRQRTHHLSKRCQAVPASSGIYLSGRLAQVCRWSDQWWQLQSRISFRLD